jgi:WD40 repeat protein
MSHVDLRDLLTQGDDLEKRFDDLSEKHQDVQDCLSHIREWLERCVDYGRFLPDPSPDRRALQGRVDYWTSLLSQRRHALPDIDRIADFDPEAGFPLDVDFPYPGLAAYTEDERAFFYGREREAKEGVAHLEENKALLLVSESGGGKSSLAMAGILPMLAQGHPDWLRAPRMTPGAQPVEALWNTLWAVLPVLSPNSSAVVGSEEAARDAVQPVVETLGGRTLVLFIDQLEELLTLCNDTRQQAAFSTFLDALTDTSDCRIVATMRMDHQQQLADSQSCRVLFRLLAANNGVKTLEPLGFDAIRAAILKPAQAVGLRFVPPEIVDKLAQQTANLVGGLPLLQFALWRLWESRPKRGDSKLDLINAEQLKNLPGVQEALGTAAQAQYEALTPSMQGVCERLMQELTVLAENYQEPMRRRRRESEVVRLLEQHKQANPQDVRNLINDFVHAKLLVRTGEGENAQLEVPHEALFRNWETFRNWVSGEATRERLQAIRRIGRDAAQWVGKDQAADYLNLKGEPLRKALDYAQEGWLDDVSRTYVQECKREDKKNLMVRRSLIGMIVLLVLGALVLTNYQKREAQKETRLSKSLRFAIEAQAKLDKNPINSALLALHAAFQTYFEGETIPRETKDALREVSQVFEIAYTLQGQTDQVTNVAFSPDGTHLATSSANGWVRLWQTPFDHTEPSLYFRPNPVTASPARLTSVAFSPDGTQLVAASADATARVWKVDTGQELRQFTGPTASVTSVALSLNGTQLVATSVDGTVKVWKVDTGQELRQFTGPTNDITSVSFSPDGTRLVTASVDGTVKVWDVATGQELHTLTGHTDAMTSVSFSPDGSLLVTASVDGTVKVWNAATGQELRPLAGHTAPVTSVAFSPDGTRLVTASVDGTVKVWNAATGQELRPLTGHTASATSVSFSPDGSLLVTASVDGTVKVWNAATGQELRPLAGHTAPVTSVAFSPDGSLLVTGSADRTARVWNAATGQELRQLTGPAAPVTSVAFSPKGTWLVIASADRTVKVWDVATGQELRLLADPAAPVTNVAFSPDGTRLVTASADRTVKVWDVATGQELHTLTGHTASVTGVSFSPDGSLFVTASVDRTVKVWDVATGQELHTLTGHTDAITSVSFSPDGTRLVTASADRTVKVWDVATGQELRPLTGHTASVTGVSFSPDGSLLVTASVDGTVKVWDVATGQELHTLTGHTARIRSVTFDPYKPLHLITASADGIVKVWSLRTGKERFSITAPKAGLLGAAFSPDSRTLVTVREDGSVWRNDLLYDLYDEGSTDSEKLIGKVEDHVMKLCNIQDKKKLKAEVESEESRTHCSTKLRQ